MNQKTIFTTIFCALSLIACSPEKEPSQSQSTGTSNTTHQTPKAPQKPEDFRYSLNKDGAGVCLQLLKQHLGEHAKVLSFNETYTYWDKKPEMTGMLISCAAEYQSPEDHRKLLNTTMNYNTGVFAPPTAVTIRVPKGKEESFRLDLHLIPLGSIDMDAIRMHVQQQMPKMQAQYDSGAFDGIAMRNPDFNTPEITLGYSGYKKDDSANRLHSAIGLSMDGKTIIKPLYQIDNSATLTHIKK